MNALSQEEFDALTAQSERTITAKVLADSLHPDGETRLTTVELTYPRMIHAEFMTHREFSRNSASSRAIPISKMLERIETNPFVPLHWGKNQKGMQAFEELTAEQKLQAGYAWIKGSKNAIATARELEEIGIHKQNGNRPTETWMWITVIASSTNFENLFALRCHPDAEPHFQNLAYKLRNAYDASTPRELYYNEWHLPLIGLPGDENIFNEFEPRVIAQISAGRCGRVSYLTHEGIRDPQDDIQLFHRLVKQIPRHASPLEHPAMCNDKNAATAEMTGWGNFKPGFWQLRKQVTHECIFKRGQGQPTTA